MADKNPDVTATDLDPNEMPVRTPDSAGSGYADTGEKVLSEEEHQDLMSDRRKNPVDFTVDSDEEREREYQARTKIIGYDPIIHANKPSADVTQDAATWDDLRSLEAPPPVTTKGVKVYVCIQHPELIIFSPDGQTVLGKFEGGYLSTDSPVLQKVLEHPSQKYIKRLEMKVA